jgi:hypothetical protein
MRTDGIQAAKKAGALLKPLPIDEGPVLQFETITSRSGSERPAKHL